MASITVTVTAVCSGGGHLTYTITGDRSATVRGDTSEMLTAIGDEDLASFVRVITKLAKIGRTVAQAKSLLQAGVVVTV